MKNFSLVEQRNLVQIKQLFDLFQQMWWSEGRTIEQITIMLKTSLSFGLVENGTQNLVGYALAFKNHAVLTKDNYIKCSQVFIYSLFLM